MKLEENIKYQTLYRSTFRNMGAPHGGESMVIGEK
jgi:hypothetical protein